MCSTYTGEDAHQVLKYMASNGLVANARKTAFLLLNSKQAGVGAVVRIGEEVVKRESSALLLGIQFQDNLQWKSQIYGKGGILSALNSRLYIIRRLKSHFSIKSILRMVDGIFTSKIRYGLQLLGRVRSTSSDPQCADLKEIQLIQNQLLRCLNGSKINDRISRVSLLQKFNTLSVNQINAQIKLQQVWKALHVENYPLNLTQQSIPSSGVSTRAALKGKPVEIGNSNLTMNTSTSDAIRIWNKAPESITEAKSLFQARNAIKEMVKKACPFK